jgi:hypothetical protein
MRVYSSAMIVLDLKPSSVSERSKDSEVLSLQLSSNDI